jgi:hypothetical protein
VTDVTNASRTLLFNLATLAWDEQLLAAFDIPKQILPTVSEVGFYFALFVNVYVYKISPGLHPSTLCHFLDMAPLHILLLAMHVFA